MSLLTLVAYRAACGVVKLKERLQQIAIIKACCVNEQRHTRCRCIVVAYQSFSKLCLSNSFCFVERFKLPLIAFCRLPCMTLYISVMFFEHVFIKSQRAGTRYKNVFVYSETLNNSASIVPSLVLVFSSIELSFAQQFCGKAVEFKFPPRVIKF